MSEALSLYTSNIHAKKSYIQNVKRWGLTGGKKAYFKQPLSLFIIYFLFFLSFPFSPIFSCAHIFISLIFLSRFSLHFLPTAFSNFPFSFFLLQPFPYIFFFFFFPRIHLQARSTYKQIARYGKLDRTCNFHANIRTSPLELISIIYVTHFHSN